MGKFIDESKILNSNVFAYEDRLSSSYTRMLSNKPTYTTYFHINNIESMTDSGFINIEKVIGKKSPLRFNEVKEFPIYNLPQIQLDLSENEEGLNTEYEGEGTILPNTIQPYPNDCFIINYLKVPALFMITNVAFDTIKSNNYYRINYTLRSLSQDEINELYKQVTDRYTCDIKNIGTEDKFLIKDDDKIIIEKIKSIKQELLDSYKLFYYNKKYNSFIFNRDEELIYDRNINFFIHNNKLYSDKMNSSCIHLSNEDYDNLFDFEYDDSFYRAIETRKLKEVKDEYLYREIICSNSTCIFKYFGVDVKGVRTSGGNIEYIDSELLEKIKNGYEEGNCIEKTIGQFMTTDINIRSIDIDELTDYKFKKYDEYHFRLIPIIIHILNDII